MLTTLGKWIRKWRIDHDSSLYVMSKALCVSTSYLSAIETGKRTPSQSFVGKMADYMELIPEEREELFRLVDQSRKELKLDMRSLPEEKQELAICFARKIESLSDEDRKMILQLLQRK